MKTKQATKYLAHLINIYFASIHQHIMNISCLFHLHQGKCNISYKSCKYIKPSHLINLTLLIISLLSSLDVLQNS